MKVHIMKEGGHDYNYDHVLLFHNFGFLTTVAYQTLFIGSRRVTLKLTNQLYSVFRESSCFFYANDTVL